MSSHHVIYSQKQADLTGKGMITLDNGKETFYTELIPIEDNWKNHVKHDNAKLVGVSSNMDSIKIHTLHSPRRKRFFIA